MDKTVNKTDLKFRILVRLSKLIYKLLYVFIPFPPYNIVINCPSCIYGDLTTLSAWEV